MMKRPSQTTSPSMQPTSPVDDGRDQWDMQLAGIPNNNHNNNYNNHHHYNNNNVSGGHYKDNHSNTTGGYHNLQGSTPQQHQMNNQGQGNTSSVSTSGGRRTSTHRGATPPTGSTSKIPSAVGQGQTQQQQQQHLQQQQQQQNVSGMRFIKEQMIAAAVAGMIQCNVNVPTSFIDFQGKSDADLDFTLSQINQILAQQHFNMNNNNNGIHYPGSTLNQEITFDPNMFAGGGGLSVQDRMAQAARPQAPIGHQRTPIVTSGGVGGPGTSSGASPPLVRLSTPAMNNIYGIGNRNTPLYKSQSAVGGQVTFMTPRNSNNNNTVHMNNNNNNAGEYSPHYNSINNNNNNNNNNNTANTYLSSGYGSYNMVSPGHANNNTAQFNSSGFSQYNNNSGNVASSLSHQQLFSQPSQMGQQQQTNPPHHSSTSRAINDAHNNNNNNNNHFTPSSPSSHNVTSNNNNNNNNNTSAPTTTAGAVNNSNGSGGSGTNLSDTSSQGSLTYKPKAQRPAYNAALIPNELNTNASVSAARVKQMKVARSVSSAFSQHSESTSTSQIQPSNRNNASMGSHTTSNMGNANNHNSNVGNANNGSLSTAPVTGRSDDTTVTSASATGIRN